MAIQFSCKCGRLLRATAEAAGKKTRCPGCNQVLTIPAEAGKPAAVAATAPEADPFAPELDWSSLASPAPEAARPASGVIKVDAAVADAPVADIPPTEDGSLQYRVLAQKDQGFVGKFNPAKVEEVLNAHAKKGWALKTAVAMTVPGHGGQHDELILILER